MQRISARAVVGMTLWMVAMVAATRGEDDIVSKRASLFAYAVDAPPGVAVERVEQRGAVSIRDISFLAQPGDEDSRTKAFVVVPEGSGPCAGVLWVHWLGEPESTNRTEFLDEAVTLAERGVISVLPDTMWAAPGWYKERVLAEDFSNGVKQVIALRRALDLLCAEPRVDRQRIGVVAHDYGAMYGALAIAFEQRRVTTCVFIAATASFNDWAFYVKKPESMDAYLEQNRPLELTDYVAAIRGVSVFMQFAGQDEYVPRDRAELLFAAAHEPRHMQVYPEAGHEMTAPPAILDDRTAWLVKELRLEKSENDTR